MRLKLSAGLIGVSVIFALVIMALPLIPRESTTTQEDTLQDTQGNNVGDIQGAASLTLYNSNNEVLQATLFQFFSGRTAGTGPAAPEVEYNVQDPEDDPTEFSQITQHYADGEEVSRVRFVINWVEVRGEYVSKEALYIRMKVRVLLANGEWSSKIDENQIPNGEFRFTDISASSWIARADETTISDGDIRITLDEETAGLDLAYPVQFRFYYYAKSTDASGNEIESKNIEQRLTLTGSSSLGITGSGMIVLFRRILACVSV